VCHTTSAAKGRGQGGGSFKTYVFFSATKNDLQVGGGGNGAGVSERRRRSKVAATMELEPKQHNRLDRLKIRKQISTTLLFRSAATLKPIRMECCLPTTAGLAPTMWVNCEPTVWPDTCCSVHYIRVLLQWTKRI